MIGVLAQLGSKIAGALTAGAEKAPVGDAQKSNERQDRQAMKPTGVGDVSQTGVMGSQSDPGIPDYNKDPKGAQQFLKDQGFDIAVDGQFGKNSQRALEDYTFKQEYGDMKPVQLVHDTIKNLPNVVEKGSELTSGGGISPKTAKFASQVIPQISELLPDNQIRLTGGNDAYHQKKYKQLKEKGYKSHHTGGNALDFTIFPAGTTKLTPEMTKQLDDTLDKLKSQPGYGKTFRVIDEYRKGSRVKKGGHIHIAVLKDGKWESADGHKH